MINVKNKNRIANYIETFDLGEVFNPDLIEHMSIMIFEKGESICKLKESLEYFYLLVSGKIKIYAFKENGKKILIRFYRPLNAIGDLEYLTDYSPEAIVESLETTEMLAVPMPIIRQYTYECPVFLRFIIKQLSQKLYTYSNTSSFNLAYTLENRLASYLWSLSNLSNTKHSEEIRVSNLEEMADLLCTSYRHLNRILKQFETEGILTRKRGHIRIIDFDKLDQLSVGLFE